MASFHAKDGYLYIDFRWRGLRCREATRLEDNKDNRARVRLTVRQIDGDIAAGTFEYQRWFPRGRKAGLFAPPESNAPPLYAAYVRRWLADKTARLGAGTAYDWRRIVESRLIPVFGERRVSDIDVEAVEGFIASLKRGDAATPPAPDTRDRRKRPRAPTKLSNRRVNIIVKVLRQSLDRPVSKGWLADNPARKIDLLREDKPDIDPLSLDEVKTFVADGLQDDEHRRYFRVAFFTGLRPGEQVGLQWADIDWQRRLIGVRRSLGRFGEGSTKTVESNRDVAMLMGINPDRVFAVAHPVAVVVLPGWPARGGGVDGVELAVVPHRDVARDRPRGRLMVEEPADPLRRSSTRSTAGATASRRLAMRSRTTRAGEETRGPPRRRRALRPGPGRGVRRVDEVKMARPRRRGPRF